MRSVVFSEGFNDLLLLSELHQYASSTGSMYDVFNNEETDLQQNRRLHQHKIGEQFPILYKSEGGRDKLIPMFAEMTVEIYEWANMCLLIDLDGDHIQDIIGEINSEYQPEWGNRVQLEEDHSSRDILTHTYITKLSLKIQGSTSTEIDLIAFDDDLESATNINDSESESSKRGKIRTYIQRYTSDVDRLCQVLYS